MITSLNGTAGVSSELSPREEWAIPVKWCPEAHQPLRSEECVMVVTEKSRTRVCISPPWTVSSRRSGEWRGVCSLLV